MHMRTKTKHIKNGEPSVRINPHQNPAHNFRASAPEGEWTRYPSHFVSQAPDENPEELTLVRHLSEGDPIHGTFLGPVRLRQSHKLANISTVYLFEYHRLPLNTAAKVIIPFLLLLACISNIFILRVSYKLSFRKLPIAIYFVYLSIFDQLDLLARGTDYLVEAYGGIRLFTAMQFVSRSSCQLLSMAHSAVRHLQSALLIGLSIDLCQWSAKPVRFWIRFRSEWTQNVALLAAILAIILDSQFLWTFDLSPSDITQLHGRPVQNIYQCGYSQTSTLSPLFLYYVWPIMDHLWGDVLPCLACTIAGIFSLICSDVRRRNLKKAKAVTQYWASRIQQNDRDQMSQLRCSVATRWINLDLIVETIRAFAMVLLTTGIFILPRCFYYLIKYALFSNVRLYKAPNVRNELSADESEFHGQNAFINRNQASHLQKYESSLEAIEFMLRCLGAVNTIVCAIILSYTMTPFRRELLAYRGKIICLLRLSALLHQENRPFGTQRLQLINDERTTIKVENKTRVTDSVAEPLIVKEYRRRDRENRDVRVRSEQNQIIKLNNATGPNPQRLDKSQKHSSKVEQNFNVDSTKPDKTFFTSSPRNKSHKLYSL
ncbi:hypothetical protein CLF_111729 [Clonorchis sinensis]|uniref:Uncharacterized protein n=2 Tax=Clonorchis sinensis TaxID=79923 RepID=G7YLX8_CLOSI|nr:hypothetical protein CLF_111729 [Clonorchis sinensis]